MTIFNVSSASELQNALSQATGGDEIRLAGGDYGDLTLTEQFSSEVTLVSADRNDPAEFSSVVFNNASYITFDGIDFKYTRAGGDPIHTNEFDIQNSSNITLQNGSIIGDSGASGYPWGRGLFIRGSDDVTVDNMEIANFDYGIMLYDNEDIVISNNDIHTIGGDGIQIQTTVGMLIEGNHIHSFVADPSSGTHQDMIQVFTLGADSPTENLTIRGNILDMADGVWTQSIFMGNEEGNNPAMFYQNIVIENNVIYNAHIHGVTVGQANGVIIRDNSLIRAEMNLDIPGNVGHTGGVTIPQINVSDASTGVVIEDNVAASFPDAKSGWTVVGNVAIQQSNSGANNHYDNVFIYHATGQEDGYNQFGVVKGSIIDISGAGSSLMDGNGSSPGDTPPDEPVEEPPVEEPPVEEPDVGSPDDGGGENDDEAAPGAGNGETDASGVLENFDDYILDIAQLANNHSVRLNGDAHFDGSGIAFDGKKDWVDIGRLEQFEQSEQIAFTVEFARDEADGSGQRLVWNHMKQGLALDGDGLIVRIANNDGGFNKLIRIDNLGLNDTDTHRITVIADQEADRLQVIVDDMLVLDEMDMDLDFVGAGGGEWGWMLGTPWGGDVDGVVSDFRIDDDVTFLDSPVDDVSLIM